MAVSSFMGLQTALRGLLADQEAIDTTGHNIANANTPGYSRQRPELTESVPLTIPAYSNVTGGGVQLGTGVDVTTITRIRDQFLDIQYRAQNTSTSNASAGSTILDQVQTGLAEPSDHGLANDLSNFWGAWSDLANDPTGSAARQTVIQDGTTVAATLNQLSQQLSTIQSQTAQQYAAITGPNGQVVADANQIASLNAAISSAQAAGQTPNDLMDQRDKLIDDLSSMANVSVTNPGNGLLQITFGDAASPLVNGTTVNWPQTLTAAAGGQLGALLSLSGAGGQLATYQSQLDAVANQLATSVNALHTSTPFFAGTTAATISVAATSATIQTGSTGAPGANDVALAISGLSGGAADAAYAQFVTGVGSDVQNSENAQATQSSLLTAINNQRQSVSGVSLDEEMTNLITFQRGYEASSRVMSAIDSMLDTLINHTGRAGL